MSFTEYFDPYYGCRDNTTPAPVKRDRLLVRIDQTDMTMAEIEKFAAWYMEMHPEMDVVIDGDACAVVARENRDKVLVRIDQTDMTMSDVIGFIGWYKATHPGLDVFMDGDAYAIVARARRLR